MEQSLEGRIGLRAESFLALRDETRREEAEKANLDSPQVKRVEEVANLRSRAASIGGDGGEREMD